MNKNFRKYIKPSSNNIVLIYCSYLLGMFVPIISLVGLYFAYVNRQNLDKVLNTHYKLALRTFIFIFAGWLGSDLVIGSLFEPLIRVAIFMLVMLRSVIALDYLLEGHEHPNPNTLWIK